MKKTTKILTTLTLLAAVCGGGYYYTQLYPDHKDISRLETLIYQMDFYDDKFAGMELEIFPVDRLKQLAEKNYPIAQYQLGKYYQRGKNEEEAKKWFSRAANQNFAPAYRALAYTYDYKSYEQKTFLAKAASLGDIPAKFDYKNIPALGELAKMDYLPAQRNLIDLYFDDKDSHNWEKAFYWAEKYYENTKKYNTAYIENDHYQKLAILYYLGIGTTPDIAKAEKILAEYIALLENSGLEQYYKEVFKDIDHLKMELVVRNDQAQIRDKVAQDKIQKIKEEFQANNGAERFFKQANILLDMVLKAKKEEVDQLQLIIFIEASYYFGISCDMGNQAGCDKYAELNSK
ncbi:SEL1-like repeat protein [Glaesserella parasuis]|uniref:tetratricopeptide repeat protein n=1 Tax=Glaesserella parasuis TaxID=738 RepID=UPI0013664FA0|nr:SEL1-like repeat protein [Glaesserella parasuis]MDO9771331.1 SEL1-like repeat protein [Glaesserella parasuis]MDO9773467.1 SEL1-like repeat protein [Glaesserella parasuis]MDO9803174.1 SEL1-like repeat protein [Glaesserella parasuis]MDO9807267.1 SEL1-like repeat protein [Glaesserella parasuis]